MPLYRTDEYTLKAEELLRSLCITKCYRLVIPYESFKINSLVIIRSNGRYFYWYTFFLGQLPHLVQLIPRIRKARYRVARCWYNSPYDVYAVE